MKTIFSPDRKYRYTLWRTWFSKPTWYGTFPYVMFVGLNPSTADETKDDPTVRRCIQFAKDWGYSALCMTNLFAWRDTSPKEMMKQENPIGEENDLYLLETSFKARQVVAAWGKNGSHMNRGNEVKKMITALYCLRMNKDGSPEHPLYLPKTLQPIPYL